MTSDADLDSLPHTALLASAKSMRRAIRAHLDATEHDLCWHHPDMWALLPDSPQVNPVVPEWPQFMCGCIRYRHSLDQQLSEAPRTGKEF